MMDTLETISDEEVPKTVASLRPHRWQRKTDNLGHIEVTRWNASESVAPAQKQPTKKFIAQPVRTLRSRAMDEEKDSLNEPQTTTTADVALSAILQILK